MRNWREALAWWPILVIVWLATLNSFGFVELIAAAVCAVPCALIAPAARRAAGAHWRLRIGGLSRLRRLPWTIVRDSVRVLTVLRPGTDTFERLPLCGSPDPGREAVQTLLVGASPGSIVVDSVRHRELLVHPLPNRTEQETS